MIIAIENHISSIRNRVYDIFKTQIKIDNTNNY